MRALLVVAHPRTDSFTHAAAEAVHRGLEHAGHDVDVIDLYAVGSATAMSRDERAAYHGDEPLVDGLAGTHPDPHFDGPIGQALVVDVESLLDRHRGVDGGRSGRECRHRPVAGVLYHPALARLDLPAHE